MVQRRRGDSLRAAILISAWHELAERGFAQFSIDSVAARAHAGKASIYSRWCRKSDLIADAISEYLPAMSRRVVAFRLDESTTTAEALLLAATSMSRMLAGSTGGVLRALLSANTDPMKLNEMLYSVQLNCRRAVIGVLQRGIGRCEIRTDAAVEIIGDVLPAILFDQVVFQRRRLSVSELRDIVEQVIVPVAGALPT